MIEFVKCDRLETHLSMLESAKRVLVARIETMPEEGLLALLEQTFPYVSCVSSFAFHEAPKPSPCMMLLRQAQYEGIAWHALCFHISAPAHSMQAFLQ